MKKLTILVLLWALLPCCGKTQEPTYEGKPLSAWVQDLSDASAETQSNAQEALVAIGKPAVLPMVKILKKQKDTAVKVRATYVLAYIGQDAKDAAPTLNRGSQN